MNALSLETVGLTKRFGAFTALDDVSLTVRPGTVHALLGENGAGKSTFVKCVVGYYKPDDGAVMVDNREQAIPDPTVARALGIGMVYQHFTVVPGMTVAENLLMARGALPAVVPWRRMRAELQAFLDQAPFQLDLDATPRELSAGEKQKLEILKQLYLQPRLLILDEPTSVLTPQEADEVLGALRERAHRGDCSVIMITHKFREVDAHADDVTVLRGGRLVESGAVADTSAQRLAQAMVGSGKAVSVPLQRQARERGGLRLSVQGLQVAGDRGEPAVQGLDLAVHDGEIVGVAGVSGNGQRELMQALTGQRRPGAGRIEVAGERFRATRAQNRQLQVRALPEEPLQNACVGELSVAQNMALRQFDEPPFATTPATSGGMRWVRWGRLRQRARDWIAEYGVKTRSEREPIRTLSGGNVQRAVLARELSGQAQLLLVSNPVFGLDFSAVAEIHGRLMAARNRGCAVLLLSEDLDELLLLADRIVVISEGRIVYDVAAAEADRHTLGAHMGGKAHHGAAAGRPRPSGCGGRMSQPIPAQPFPFALDLAHAALVIIDMQRDFVEPGGFGASLGNDVTRLQAIVPACQALLAAWRAAGGCVVHTREGHAPDLSDCPPAKRLRGNPSLRIGDPGPMGRLLVIGEPGHAIIDALAPAAGELVIDKPGKGAFHATPLQAELRSRGITQLVIAGVTTEVCVQTTMREANDRGYDCLLVEDCTASYFPEFKAATLAMLTAQGGIVGWSAPSAAVIAGLPAAAS